MALVPSRGGDHEFALARVVRGGLLDIDMFAGGAGEDGRGRVPVIRRGDEEGIHVLVVQDAPKILHAPGRFRSSEVGLLRARQARLVNVGQIGDLDVGDLLERLHMIEAAAQPHHAHHQFLAGAFGGLRSGEKRCSGKAKTEERGASDKIAPMEWWVHGRIGRQPRGLSSINFGPVKLEDTAPRRRHLERRQGCRHSQREVVRQMAAPA